MSFLLHAERAWGSRVLGRGRGDRDGGENSDKQRWEAKDQGGRARFQKCSDFVKTTHLTYRLTNRRNSRCDATWLFFFLRSPKLVVSPNPFSWNKPLYLKFLPTIYTCRI